MIRVQVEGKVRRIRLAAAERKNILDARLSALLIEQFEKAEADTETSVVLLDAEGPVFCGGATADIAPEIYSVGSRSTKPIVAGVQGVVLGAGLALLAGAHVAVAAQGTSFGFTDIREGRWNHDLYQALARSIGNRRALELGLTGRIFTAPEALSWGLVHAVAPAFELEDRAAGYAQGLARADESAVRAALTSGNTRSSL